MSELLANLVHDASEHGPRGIRAAARLMTIMTDQPQRLAELLRGAKDWREPRMVLGITGAPGSGKSTLTDHIAAEFRSRFPDRRIGIIAVDPSSPFTGGALLGDRVRMMRHATDPMVFIRSLASRGHLGGLALGAKGVARVMGLIGCDVVLVETVGVGQSEVEIASNADLTMVVLAPGQGDSIQMLKAGLMEAGDLFVVNKADREGASQLYQSLLSALQLESMARRDLCGKTEPCGPHHGITINAHHVAQPPNNHQVIDEEEQTEVFLVSASNHQNISSLVDSLESITERNTATWSRRRQEMIAGEVRDAVFEIVRKQVLRAMQSDESRIDRVMSGDLAVTELAHELMREVVESNQSITV